MNIFGATRLVSGRWSAAAAVLSLSMALPGPAVASGHDGDNTVEQAAQSAERMAQEVAADVQDATSDLVLHAKLEAKLAESDELSAMSIDTDVQDGVASLEGEVTTETQKTLGTELALSIDGITAVRNELRVMGEEPTPTEQAMQKANDAAVTASVKSRLLVSQHTSGLDIDVDTSDQVVTLSGEVDSGAEKQLAGLIAQNTYGVENVVNRLEVHEH